MLQKLQKAIHTKFGQIIISIILGLGLASLFRKACDELNCLTFTAPKASEIQETVYKHGDSCYKFKAITQECNKEVNSVRFA